MKYYTFLPRFHEAIGGSESIALLDACEINQLKEYTMGPNLDGFFMLVSILGFIFIPLGMWKLIEIIFWLFANVRIGVAS